MKKLPWCFELMWNMRDYYGCGATTRIMETGICPYVQDLHDVVLLLQMLPSFPDGYRSADHWRSLDEVLAHRERIRAIKKQHLKNSP